MSKRLIVEIIVACIGCLGLTFAAIIGLGLPFVQRIANPTPIVITATPQLMAQQTPATQVEPKTIVIVVTATPQPMSQPTTASVPPTSVPVQPPVAPSYAEYSDWVICWHGRSGHEYLIAYSKGQAQNGINLTIPIQPPWGGNDSDLTNDSLKMCLANGTWYGDSLMQYFPFASYLQLGDGQITVCENSPGCMGKKWTLKPGDAPPSVIVSLLRRPNRSAEILGYIQTSQLP